MPSTLDTLLSYLERRNLGLLDDIEDEADELEDEQETGSEPTMVANGIGYIEVCRALTYKPVMGMWEKYKAFHTLVY